MLRKSFCFDPQDSVCKFLPNDKGGSNFISLWIEIINRAKYQALQRNEKAKIAEDSLLGEAEQEDIDRCHQANADFYDFMEFLYTQDMNYGWKEQFIFERIQEGLFGKHQPENWVVLARTLYFGLTASNN